MMTERIINDFQGNYQNIALQMLQLEVEQFSCDYSFKSTGNCPKTYPEAPEKDYIVFF